MGNKIKLEERDVKLTSYVEQFAKAANTGHNDIEIKSLEDYSLADILYPQRYFYVQYGHYGSKVIFGYSKEYYEEHPDTEMLEFDLNAGAEYFAREYGAKIIDDSRINEKNEMFERQTYIIFDELHLLMYIESTPAKMCMYYDNVDTMLKMKDEYCKFLYRITDGNKIKKKISYIVRDSQQYSTIESDIKHFSVDIDEQYNDDFAPCHESIKKFLNEDKKSGLVILSGDVGTGKTTYLRHLIETTKRKFVYLTSDLANALTDPSFIPFLYTLKGSILVLEDCENLVRSREDGNFSTGISTILNMCDGLMGDVFDLKIIATFNTDVSKIDKALLRKGRLVCRYEFKKLAANKSTVLFKKLGKDIKATEPMSLADIYNYDANVGNNKNERKKIGF